MLALMLDLGIKDQSIILEEKARKLNKIMLDLGIKDQSIILEEKARKLNKMLNLRIFLLKDRRINKILLVISSTHMRRAVAIYRK